MLGTGIKAWHTDALQRQSRLRHQLQAVANVADLMAGTIRPVIWRCRLLLCGLPIGVNKTLARAGRCEQSPHAEPETEVVFRFAAARPGCRFPRRLLNIQPVYGWKDTAGWRKAGGSPGNNRMRWHIVHTSWQRKPGGGQKAVRRGDDRLCYSLPRTAGAG